MDILLTNDDGIRARGIRALYSALTQAGNKVHVVAPMRQQSGVGHSLTVFEPVRAVEIDEDGFHGLGVYGTPTDCVKLALGSLLPKMPDIVVSGINAGPNVGPDILYSGTVAAATEAALEELPAVAVSHDDHKASIDLLPQARHLADLILRLDWSRLPKRRVLNINYPAGVLSDADDIKICPQTGAVWKNVYTERRDPRGARYWWLEGEIPPHTVNFGSDKDMLNKGHITITPLRFEFTDPESMAFLRDTLE
ncbi:MAG: 5'/3'-nucleotidase SurE [Desulfovibrio sp.]|jgi:5'-nucleotidase|nr:5'/3'-nucleotidase SurE [Desulfovibrio sp.]